MSKKNSIITNARRIIAKPWKFVKRTHVPTLLGITVSIVLISSIVVLLIERGQENSLITSLTDSVWWSIATVTTVGYGDIVPHSVPGRIIGMFLMIIGIGIMAAFISQVSATLTESRLKTTAEKNNLKTIIISEIKAKIDNIDKLSDNEIFLLMEMIKTLRIKKPNETKT